MDIYNSIIKYLEKNETGTYYLQIIDKILKFNYNNDMNSIIITINNEEGLSTSFNYNIYILQCRNLKPIQILDYIISKSLLYFIEFEKESYRY